MRKLDLKRSVVYTKRATVAEQLEAALHIGETCLFSDDHAFTNYYQATLERVDIGDTVYPYGADDTLQDEYFGYMIPISHAVFTDTKDKPKLRRLDSFDEFGELTGKGIGDTITIRSTDTEAFDFMATCMVLGSATRNGTEEILIGNYSIDLDELFEEYEWDDHGTFRPFGVEE